jgi:predicted TPR repeat methyltransferase
MTRKTIMTILKMVVDERYEDCQKALVFFQHALQSDPANISLHINLSNVYTTLGDVESSIQHLHQALRLNPQFPEAYNNLGRLLYKQGRFKEAIFYLEKAIRINPRYWEAHYNIAHCLVKQNQFAQARAHYLEVVKYKPLHANAHFNLGFIQVSEEDYASAETHFNQVVLIEPKNAEAFRQLGYIYIQLGNTDAAMAALQNAVTLSSTFPDAHHNLAILHLRHENRADALHHFQTALNLDPTNDSATHMVAALTGNQRDVAPPAYISRLFDQYADHYDVQMKTQLNYQAPFALRSAIGRLLDQRLKPGRVLDLGCGTGIAGVYCRDLALELIGVDISEKMLEKAKALMTYESLIKMDITDYLAQIDLNPFDLIIASDVLVYYGDLKTLFSLIRKNLNSNGSFSFTTELLKQTTEEPSYHLQSTGRFAHSEQYIRSIAIECDLNIAYHETISLREQKGDPVPGQLFILQRKEPS